MAVRLALGPPAGRTHPHVRRSAQPLPRRRPRGAPHRVGLRVAHVGPPARRGASWRQRTPAATGFGRLPRTGDSALVPRAARGGADGRAVRDADARAAADLPAATRAHAGAHPRERARARAPRTHARTHTHTHTHSHTRTHAHTLTLENACSRAHNTTQHNTTQHNTTHRRWRELSRRRPHKSARWTRYRSPRGAI
jgi:hypothetical protein